MKRLTLAVAVLVLLLGLGCSSGQNPMSPQNQKEVVQKAEANQRSQTHLWGLWTVTIDAGEQTVEAVPARNAMFTANVVNFLNSNPANMAFKINKINTETGYTDIDIDVSLRHPFPGMTQYNGYDVRGVFMGDGSGTLAYNSEIQYAVAGTDQTMLPNPVSGAGGPDGYTRWFNYTEFSGPGMPLFLYTQGKAASPSFAGTATLNPYKYYADGLGATDDLWTWISAHGDNFGVFSAGQANTRNYYLRFPTGKGIVYGYAVTANWTAPDVHPSNAPEAVALSVIDNSDVYYASSSDKGGNLKLDVSVWNWGGQLSVGAMDEYAIKIESTVLSAPYEADGAAMTPTDGGDNWFTYHLEIPADNVTGTYNQSYWVIVEEKNTDYTNSAGVPNLANTDKLAAFFPYHLTVGTQSAECPVPNPTAIDPESDTDAGPVDVTITCSNLYKNTGIQAYLDMSGAIDGVYDIAATNIHNINLGAGTFDCTFDITGKPIGSYFVIVSNECGETGASTSKLFTIIEYLDGDYYVSNSVDFNGVQEVGTMQEPFHTIQKALDAATNDGNDLDLILVDYGTGRYPEVLAAPQVGNDTGNFTLRAYNWHSGSGRPTIGGLDVVSDSYTTVNFWYCNNATIQGFTLTYITCTGGSPVFIYMQYFGTNTLIKDCWFTGDTQDGITFCEAIAMLGVNGPTLENCLFKGINVPHPSSSVTIYALDWQVNYNITIVRNEFTQFQMTGPSNGQSISLYTGYEGGHYGNFKVANNLYHHMWPSSSDAGSFSYTGENYWNYYTGYNDPDYPFEVAHNTWDSIDGTAADNSSAQGIYNWMYCEKFTTNSNILTNFNNSSPAVGINDVDLPDHNNLWNGVIWGCPQGAGNISDDPKYVNNTSEPYDYHLAAGSPCIGTGRDGTDMGCYGDLGAGEKIGLLTSED